MPKEIYSVNINVIKNHVISNAGVEHVIIKKKKKPFKLMRSDMKKKVICLRVLGFPQIDDCGLKLLSTPSKDIFLKRNGPMCLKATGEVDLDSVQPMKWDDIQEATLLIGCCK